MENLEKILKGIAAQTRANSNNDGDYIKNDIIHCVKCHTPKEKLLDFGIGLYKQPHMCDCEYEAYQEQQRQEKEAMRKERIKRNRVEGITGLYVREYTFDKAEPNSQNLAKSKRYADKFEEAQKRNVGLLFHGGVGTGKTFMAGCIANAVIDKGHSVYMTTFGQILSDLMSNNIDKGVYINKLVNKSLLIIDDFGTQRDTSFALEQVFNVIDSRHLAKKPLILTTNLPFKEIKTATDVKYRRIYDRILDMCLPVKFEGQSKRANKNKFDFLD